MLFLFSSAKIGIIPETSKFWRLFLFVEKEKETIFPTSGKWSSIILTHGVRTTCNYTLVLTPRARFLTFEQLTSLLSDELAQPWCAATPIAALGP